MADQTHWVRFEKDKDYYRMTLDELRDRWEWRQQQWWYPLERAYYNTKNFITDIPYQTKWFYQRVTRGFDDRDVWGLEYAMTRFIYPRLKMFCQWQREFGRGLPGDFENDPAGWLETLNKIERAFEHMAKDGFIPPFTVEDFHSVPSKRDFATEAEHEEAVKQWRKESQQIEEEVKEGLALFGKYYRNLWD